MYKGQIKIIFVFAILIFCSILLINTKIVNAEGTYQTSLSSSKNTVGANETFTISINVSELPSDGLGSANYTLSFDNTKYEYISSQSTNQSVSNNLVENEVNYAFLDISGGSNPIRNGVFVTATFKVKSGITGRNSTQFSLTSAGTRSGNNTTLTSNNTGKSIEIFVPSTASNLTALSITNGTLSPSFSSGTLSYTATVDNATTNISATAVSGATISGTGTKSLNYGTNSFNVVVTAEDGTTKTTYTININRPDNRSTNNKLSNITLSSGTISFNKNTNSYNVTIPSNISILTFDSTAEDIKSTITYDPSSKSLTLNYGETKQIKITVKSEKGTENLYTINVTRTDDRSTNNYLKTLTISEIDLDFNKGTINYKKIVENSISSINIDATTEDNKATLTGVGSKNLKVGSNTFQIKVTSEKETDKTYTIVIIRKDENGLIPGLSSNTKLKTLKVNDKNISLKNNEFNYKMYVESDITKANIVYVADDSKSVVAINGNENLSFGENKFEIIVTAENGASKKYTVNVIKKKPILRETVSNKNSKISKDKFKTAKDEFQDLFFSVKDNNNKELYTWEFKSEDIKDLTISPSLDISVDSSEYKDKIIKLSKIDKITNITFKYDGELPGKAKITLDVSDKYKNGDIVNFYYYDPKTDTIKIIKENIKVEEGKISFELEHCSEYFITETVVNQNITNPKTDVNISLFVTVFILATVVVSLLIIKKIRYFVRV